MSSTGTQVAEDTEAPPSAPSSARPAAPPSAPSSARAAGAEDRNAPPLARRAPARPLGRRLAGLLLRGVTKSVAIVALLALWEIAPRAGLVDSTFLPPFSVVAGDWWTLATNGQLWANTEASLVRSLSGFGLAVLVGVPLGLLIGWYRPVAALLGPLLELFRNTAALALLPVFILLLGIGETSKIAIVLYACTWPILLNTISAVREVDPTLLRLARSMDLSAPRIFQKVILPAAVPTIFTGIRLAGAVSILVLVAAEMVGAKAGLGYLINSAQFNFAIPDMYAGIVTIAVLGVLFNQLLVAVERRLGAWRLP
ncbi:ABC transporter permease [Streptacidiphilus anmyonensis]|uniref:ABC transporter permease n=1 Tax=Streptacidiphilus anmyonensis TaxID=405782 RepID=UPI0005A73AF0|nr:ABC transporter permease [Streptacidiphilus anmyonensis]